MDAWGLTNLKDNEDYDRDWTSPVEHFVTL